MTASGGTSSRHMPLHHALGLALAVEGLIAGLALWRLQIPAPPPSTAVTVMRIEHVDLTAPPQPKSVEPPQPQAPAPPQPAPRKPTAAKPLPARPPRPVAVATPAPRVEQPVPASVTASEPKMEKMETPTAAVPATPAPSVATSVQQEAAVRFETLLRAAVQEAAKFPAAAKAMGRQGRVRIGFDFLDGQVSALRVVQSSDFPPFDQAALAAVEEAHYPPAPVHLQHQTLHLTVWVEFLKKGY